MTPPQRSSSGDTVPPDPPTTELSIWRQPESCSEDEQIEIEQPFANYSSSQLGHLTDTESGRHCRTRSFSFIWSRGKSFFFGSLRLTSFVYFLRLFGWWTFRYLWCPPV